MAYYSTHTVESTNSLLEELEQFTNDSSRFAEYASLLVPDFNCTSLTTSKITDKIQVGYQLAAAIVGLPVNVWFLVRIILALRHHYRRVLCLNLLLTISNILVLTMCIWYTVWLMEFWWTAGGHAACKLFAFFHVFVFYLYSNATVAISLEMMLAIRYPLFSYQHSRRIAVGLVAASTVGASIASVPQLFVWDIDRAHCIDTGRIEQQCAYVYSDESKFWYSLAHNLVVFWLPIFVIIPAYFEVCACVWKHFRNFEQLTPKRLSLAKWLFRPKKEEPDNPSGDDSASQGDGQAVKSPTIVVDLYSDRRAKIRHDDTAEISGESALLPMDDQQTLSRDSSVRLISSFRASIRKRSLSGDVLRLSDQLRHGVPNGIQDPLSRASTASPILPRVCSYSDVSDRTVRISFRDRQTKKGNSYGSKGNTRASTPEVKTRRKASEPALRKSFGHADSVQSKKRLKVVKSSLAIVTVYMISWLPYQISSIWTLINTKTSGYYAETNSTAEELNEDLSNNGPVFYYLECLEAIMYIGTVVNPFLYRLSRINKAKKKLEHNGSKSRTSHNGAA